MMLARPAEPVTVQREILVLSRPRVALALILLLALALRLVNLGERSLWYDEAFSVLFADKGLAAMLYGTLTPVAGGTADIHPLLYYLTLDGWMRLVGTSPAAVRLLSVLPGIATIGVIYALARDLFDERTARTAALITAVSPFHVQYSQEARMYSLLACLLAAATWVFAHGWRASVAGSPRAWRWWLAFGLLAALAMYAQQLAAFYLAALGLIPFIARRAAPLRGLLLGVVVALLVYLPWLVQLPGQWSKVNAYYWIPVPGPARFLLTARTFFAGAIELPPPLALLALAGALVLLAFLGLQAALALRRAGRGERQPLRFVLWLAFAPVLLMWVVSQVQPVYLDRALLPSALMLYVALGWLFARGRLPRPIAAVLALIGVGLAVAGLATHYTWRSFPNSPYDAAARALSRAIQAGDLVVHQTKLSALPMIYYAPDLPQVFVADAPGSPEDTLAEPTRAVLGVRAVDCVQVIGPEADRVWYVTYAGLLAQSQAAGRQDVRAAFDWLSSHYMLDDQWQFNDLDVYRFVSPDAEARSGSCASLAPLSREEG